MNHEREQLQPSVRTTTHERWTNSFKASAPDLRATCALTNPENCQAIPDDWDEDETTISFCCIRERNSDSKKKPHLYVGERDPHWMDHSDDWDCWAPCDIHLQFLIEHFKWLGIEMGYHQLMEHA